MSVIEIMRDNHPKRWAKAALFLFAEAVIFGIGVEVGKDIFKLMRGFEDERSPQSPPLDDSADSQN